jgi:hypothetical protein
MYGSIASLIPSPSESNQPVAVNNILLKSGKRHDKFEQNCNHFF